jgi:hypothetical protein
MEKMMYGLEKVYLASKGLNESLANKRQSLQDSYIYHILHVQEHDLPVELHVKYNEIVSAVTLAEGI